MTEPSWTGLRKFYLFFGRSLRQLVLPAVLAMLFTPAISLMETGVSVSGTALAQTGARQARRSQYRVVPRRVTRKRVRVRQHYRLVKKPKKSLFGNLFAKQPKKRGKKSFQPLFGGLNLPFASKKSPASTRAAYEKNMRAAGRPEQNLAPGRRTLRDERRSGGRGSGNVARASGAGWGRGQYRTMCVRTCDGYYFPIRFRAKSRHFEGDEQRCNSECYNAPTKLFYYSNPGGSIKNMRSLDGQRYKDMENAFKYREEFVADCRCKAEPWTEQAKQQHESWAAERDELARGPLPGSDEAPGDDELASARVARNSVQQFQY